jgi:hypothetical protein
MLTRASLDLAAQIRRHPRTEVVGQGQEDLRAHTVVTGVNCRGSRSPDDILESETSRERPVNLGQAAIELELYAYVRTSDAAVFMRVRERLLLDVFAIVEAAGARFARPTQIVLASKGTIRQEGA